MKRGQKSKNSLNTTSFVSWPATPNKELIKINKDAVVIICFGYPAFIKNRIGLKKIPPPIPTIPEINPIIDPMIIDKILGILFIFISLLLNDLLSRNKKKPATIKTTNNNISNNSLVICIEAPKKTKGIEPIRYGVSCLKSKLPFLR